MHLKELETMNLEDLHRIAKDKNLKGTAGMKKGLNLLILKMRLRLKGYSFLKAFSKLCPTVMVLRG